VNFNADVATEPGEKVCTADVDVAVVRWSLVRVIHSVRGGSCWLPNEGADRQTDGRMPTTRHVSPRQHSCSFQTVSARDKLYHYSPTSGSKKKLEMHGKA